MAKTIVKRKKVVRKPASARNFKGTIVEKTEMVPLENLNLYYKNPNIGDPEKTAESLSNNGQYKSITVNRGTHTGRPNEILTGNHTYKGAKKLGWPEIQVDWVDVTNEHARRIMLADNASRDGATYDKGVLAELMQEQKQETGTLAGTVLTDDLLAGLVRDKDDSAHADVDKIEDAPDQMEGIAELNNNVYFQSDLDYEIPPLLADMIPDEPPENMQVFAGHELDGKDIIGKKEWESKHWLAMWHAGSRGINWPKAIPYFYTDDFHFEPIYEDPAKNTKKILNLGIECSFMPNYTIYEKLPTALWVWSTYRSYYVARYFQEAGLQVIPDIQTGMSDSVMDLSLIGIPQGCGVVATQCQQHKGDKQGIRKKVRLLEEAESRLKFKNLIIYGHTDADEVANRLNISANIIRITARTARRREYLNSGSTINSQKISKKRKVKK